MGLSLIRKSDLLDVCTVRVIRSAECGTDHMLERSKLKPQIMLKIKSERIKIPKHIDVSKLRDFTICETFQKDKVYKVGIEVLGLRVRKLRDWFNENNKQINKLFGDKSPLHQKTSGHQTKKVFTGKSLIPAKVTANEKPMDN